MVVVAPSTAMALALAAGPTAIIRGVTEPSRGGNGGGPQSGALALPADGGRVGVAGGSGAIGRAAASAPSERLRAGTREVAGFGAASTPTAPRFTAKSLVTVEPEAESGGGGVADTEPLEVRARWISGIDNDEALRRAGGTSGACGSGGRSGLELDLGVVRGSGASSACGGSGSTGGGAISGGGGGIACAGVPRLWRRIDGPESFEFGRARGGGTVAVAAAAAAATAAAAAAAVAAWCWCWWWCEPLCLWIDDGEPRTRGSRRGDDLDERLSGEELAPAVLAVPRSEPYLDGEPEPLRAPKRLRRGDERDDDDDGLVSSPTNDEITEALVVLGLFSFS